MKGKKQVLLGVVTYNPTLEEFTNNILDAVGQCDDWIVFDNGSDQADQIERFVKANKGHIFLCRKNRGIAYALKCIMKYAYSNGYEWVLTMDQDSRIFPDLVSTYLSFSETDGIGAMSCLMKDKNYSVVEHSNIENEYVEVEHCITSGCFMNTAAYMSTDGYDQRLFIDRVDDDICFSLRDCGYKVICINKFGLLHQLGGGKDVSWFGHSFIYTNHPAWRQYYMSRNTVYVSKKHPKLDPIGKALYYELIRIMVTFIYEHDKFAKLKNSLKGLRDGFRMRTTERTVKYE